LNTIEEIADNEDLLFEIKERAKSLGCESKKLEEIQSFINEKINSIIIRH
jgi:hypothetical protein